MAIEFTVDNILGTPVGFAEGFLGLSLYNWQRRELSHLEIQGTQISTVCCNEAGKTSFLAAPGIMYVLSCFKNAQAVVTSGSWRQVRDQLFPNLKRFKNRYPGWEFHDTSVIGANGSRCTGFSTDDAGLFEGYHIGPEGHRENPLLIIVDEAKSVQREIFEAIDRCRPTWLWLMSSPGPAEGVFYESQTKHRHLYQCSKVTIADCPHILQSAIDKIIAKYGINHPFVRSSLYAEFSGEGELGVVCSLNKYNACRERKLAWMHGERHAFLDFAAGGDENVIALRRGNKVTLEKCWVERDTMKACGEFIREFRRLGLKAVEITGDDDGLGKVMLDRLAELGWVVNRAKANDPAVDSKAYYNRSAEIWYQGADAIDKKEIILPDDEILASQLTTRKWRMFSDARLQLESKKEMKKRGLGSPDRADAVLGCMQPLSNMVPQDYTREDPFQQLDEVLSGNSGYDVPGFNAG